MILDVIIAVVCVVISGTLVMAGIFKAAGWFLDRPKEPELPTGENSGEPH